jgi:hypothetical protein
MTLSERIFLTLLHKRNIYDSYGHLNMQMVKELMKDVSSVEAVYMAGRSLPASAAEDAVASVREALIPDVERSLKEAHAAHKSNETFFYQKAFTLISKSKLKSSGSIGLVDGSCWLVYLLRDFDPANPLIGPTLIEQEGKTPYVAFLCRGDAKKLEECFITRSFYLSKIPFLVQLPTILGHKNEVVGFFGDGGEMKMASSPFLGRIANVSVQLRTEEQDKTE